MYAPFSLYPGVVHKLVVDKMKLESERVVSVIAATASNATRDLDEVHFLSLYIHTYILHAY